jgi:hypothetical protein
MALVTSAVGSHIVLTGSRTLGCTWASSRSAAERDGGHLLAADRWIDAPKSSLPRNEKVRANQMVCPDNRPPRECAAEVVFAVVLARGDTNNIGPQLPPTLAIFADCSEHTFQFFNLHVAFGGMYSAPHRLFLSFA